MDTGFARYADDLRILVRSQRAGERVKASITRYLTRELKLVVNEHKSRVVKTNDCEFLGFTFRGTKLRWSDQAFADFKHNVRRLTGRSWGVSMDYRLGRLARYIRGWMRWTEKRCRQAEEYCERERPPDADGESYQA